MISYRLEPHYSNQKSFYGKANVFVEGDELRLVSYVTTVACIYRDEEGEQVAEVYGTYSATTLKHIKEFLLQNGFPAPSKKYIEDNYIKGWD